MSDAERVSLDVDEQRLAALAAGPSDGDPVLLVPGYTGSKEDFAPILGPLAAAGLRVLAVDLPGQYQSPGPSDPLAYTPARLGATIAALARQLGPGVRLVGHSFGGLVSRATVIDTPEGFVSLVLLCSGPAALDGQRRQRIEQLAPVLASAGLPGVYAAMQSLATADPGFVAPPADVSDFLRRRLLEGSPVMLAGMGDALLAEPDRVTELAATGVATLVAHGADDDAWPPALQRDMAERLGAGYVVIPDSAHSPAVENPAGTVDALLGFWGLTVG